MTVTWSRRFFHMELAQARDSSPYALGGVTYVVTMVIQRLRK